MAKVIVYFAFDGSCREAMEFYKGCLGGTLTLMTVGESPAAAGMPKEVHGQIMHAHLEAPDFSMMASDNFGGGPPISSGNALSLMLYCSSEAEIRSIFPKLASGGTVNTDIRLEFWGSLYGDVTDRFGTRWMLNFDMPKG
ncbi:MAG: VOC family protein [Rectinemataceae bacterium]